MSMTTAIEVKKEAKALLMSIKTLSARIRKREGNLCQYLGAKLKNKKMEIQKSQKLKTEKTQNLKQLNERIPTLWDD